MRITPYIAVADDDPEDQELLASRFLKYYPGAAFRFFKNGEEITHYLQQCPTSELPAVVLLDYKMPIQTGADVLRTLQMDRRYDRVRKIVWSTSGNTQYITECTQYGGEKYFIKPNNMVELDIIIAELSSVLQQYGPPED